MKRGTSSGIPKQLHKNICFRSLHQMLDGTVVEAFRYHCLRMLSLTNPVVILRQCLLNLGYINSVRVTSTLVRVVRECRRS